MAILEVTPTSVAHHIRGWYQWWKDRIDAVQEEIAIYAESVYLAQVNKASGTKMRSSHMEEMFQWDAEFPVGEVKPGERYGLEIWLEHPNPRLAKKWDKIAKKQEVGGIIQRKKAAVLAIHREGVVSPHTRPRQFKNAGWVSIGGTPFLIRGVQKREGRKPKEPAGEIHGRKPRKRRQGKSRTLDWLYVGKQQVTLKPKRFWETTLDETIVYANQAFDKIRAELRSSEMSYG